MASHVRVHQPDAVERAPVELVGERGAALLPELRRRGAEIDQVAVVDHDRHRPRAQRGSEGARGGGIDGFGAPRLGRAREHLERVRPETPRLGHRPGESLADVQMGSERHRARGYRPRTLTGREGTPLRKEGSGRVSAVTLGVREWK